MAMVGGIVIIAAAACDSLMPAEEQIAALPTLTPSPFLSETPAVGLLGSTPSKLLKVAPSLAYGNGPPASIRATVCRA